MGAARLRRARARRETGRTLLEGPHLLGSALEAGIEVAEVFALVEDAETRAVAGEAGIDLVLVTPDVLAKVADTRTPRGPVAVIEVPEGAELDSSLALVLCEVSDPGNAGTLIRSAAAFGFDVEVVGGADPWSPKVLRSAAGAHFQTRIARSEALSIEKLHSQGYRLIASVVSGGRPPAGIPVGDGRDALLVGSEAHGLEPDVVRNADERVTVPMPGRIESLNAAVAASILMYAWSVR